jgi:DNA adenine methylase
MNNWKQSSKINRPALRFYGSQWSNAEWILSLMPPHDNRYIPFAGGLNEIIQFEPAKNEVAHDTDGRIINFFEVLRKRRDELVEQILLTPWHIDEYRLAATISDNFLEDARRFWCLCAMSVQGGPKPGKSGFRWLSEAKGRLGKTSNDAVKINHLFAIAERLKDVQFACANGLDLIRRVSHVDNSLYWLDPPFAHVTRSNGGNGYSEEWSDDRHEELANLLHEVVGYVLITGYAYDVNGKENELYKRLYGDWYREDKVARTNSGGERIQSIWMSQKTRDALRKGQMRLGI